MVGFTLYKWHINGFQQLHDSMSIGQYFWSDQFETSANPPSVSPLLWRAKITPNPFEGHVKIYLKAFPSADELKNSVHSRTASWEMTMFRLTLDAKESLEEIGSIVKVENKWVLTPDANAWGHSKFCHIDKIFPRGDKAQTVNLLIQIKIWQNPMQTHFDEEPDLSDPSFAEYFNSEHLSDVKFIFETGETINAHRFALELRCSYFKTMFSGDWKEASGSRIQVKNVSYNTFRAIIRYIYMEKFDESFPIDLLGELYSEAHMRNLHKLAKMASGRMLDFIGIETWAIYFQLGFLYNDLPLKGGAIQFAVNYWEDAVDPQVLKNILDWGGVQAIEELINAKNLPIAYVIGYCRK